VFKDLTLFIVALLSYAHIKGSTMSHLNISKHASHFLPISAINRRANALHKKQRLDPDRVTLAVSGPLPQAHASNDSFLKRNPCCSTCHRASLQP
jgi:hypothetical protein